MTELVIPLRDEAALRQDVALRAGRLRRRRRSAAASVVGVGLVAALLVGTPSPWRTSLRTTDPRTTPAQEGSSEVEIEPGTVVDDVRPGPPPRPVVARAGETSAVTNPLPPTATGGGPERTMHSPVPRMAFGRAGGVWEMAADGTGLRSLRGFAADPAWSPDGRRLAYTDEFQGVGDWKYVAVLDIETGESQPLALPAEFESFDPAWSPDGRYVVLTTRSQPWATPPDLTLQVRVFDLVTRSVWSVGVGQEAAWSPDGRIVHRCD